MSSHTARHHYILPPRSIPHTQKADTGSWLCWLYFYLCRCFLSSCVSFVLSSFLFFSPLVTLSSPSLFVSTVLVLSPDSSSVFCSESAVVHKTHPLELCLCSLPSQLSDWLPHTDDISLLHYSLTLSFSLCVGYSLGT